MKLKEMTVVQRHNTTCPYCQVLTGDGWELAEHLRLTHGLDRDTRFQVYRHQVSTCPGYEGREAVALPDLSVDSWAAERAHMGVCDFCERPDALVVAWGGEDPGSACEPCWTAMAEAWDALSPDGPLSTLYGRRTPDADAA